MLVVGSNPTTPTKEKDLKDKPFYIPVTVDTVVTKDNEVYLLELHTSGISKVMGSILFKEASKYLSAGFDKLRHPEVRKKLSHLIDNKFRCYKLLEEFQPSTIKYEGKKKVEAWLESIDSEYIISKPIVGYGGKGQKVYRKDEFKFTRAQRRRILQEYILSKTMIGTDGKEHLGSNRVNSIWFVQDGKAGFFFLPSAWKMSRYPIDVNIKRSMVLNSCAGAVSVPATEEENEIMRDFVEKVGVKLLSTIINKDLEIGESIRIPPYNDNGEFHLSRKRLREEMKELGELEFYGLEKEDGGETIFPNNKFYE